MAKKTIGNGSVVIPKKPEAREAWLRVQATDLVSKGIPTGIDKVIVELPDTKKTTLFLESARAVQEVMDGLREWYKLPPEPLRMAAS